MADEISPSAAEKISKPPDQVDMQEALNLANMFDDDNGEFGDAYSFENFEDDNDAEEPEGTLARSVADKVKAAKMLCMFCESKMRCKNEVYGPCCSADVRGAMNQAKRRGPDQLKAFQAIKKRGGQEFITCILTFKTECSGFGRGWSRPAFDFAAYEMALVMASRVQTGSKSLWMNQAAYCTWWLGQHHDETKITRTQRCVNVKRNNESVSVTNTVS